MGYRETLHSLIEEDEAAAQQQSNTGNLARSQQQSLTAGVTVPLHQPLHHRNSARLGMQLMDTSIWLPMVEFVLFENNKDLSYISSLTGTKLS